MITPTNIPTELMYAKAAFPNTDISNDYLKKMDEEEKIIAEKEDQQLKDLQEKERKDSTIGLIAGTSIGGIISSYAIYSDMKNGLYGIPYAAAFTFFFTGISATAGLFTGHIIHEKENSQLTQTITLRRIDRIDGKMRNIGKRIQAYGKVLEEKEIAELEEAQIFFSNRSMEFKTAKNKSQNTTILSQTNNIAMAPQRV